MRTCKFAVALSLWALHTGAPLFSSPPQAHSHRATFSPDPIQLRGVLTWFNLTETQEEIVRRMGPPHITAEFGSDYVSWQYRIGGIDSHDHSHIRVFRRSTLTLVSVTRAYEPERNVDEFFPPAAATSVNHYPDSQKSTFAIRVRILPGNRLLMAMGNSQPGQTTGQLVLLNRAELRFFYPWLDGQLSGR